MRDVQVAVQTLPAHDETASDASADVDVDEAKIDRLLHSLHEADPTGERPDPEHLKALEGAPFSVLTSNFWLSSFYLRFPCFAKFLSQCTVKFSGSLSVRTESQSMLTNESCFSSATSRSVRFDDAADRRRTGETGPAPRAADQTE